MVHKHVTTSCVVVGGKPHATGNGAEHAPHVSTTSLRGHPTGEEIVAARKGKDRPGLGDGRGPESGESFFFFFWFFFASLVNTAG